MSLNSFHRILSYLSQLKIISISCSISFFSLFLQIFIFSWRLYHLALQSRPAIFNTSYLLSRIFSSVPSALSVTTLINSFGISNPAISNFHHVELFSRSLQLFLGLFSIAISNVFISLIRMLKIYDEKFDGMFIFPCFNKRICRSSESLTSKV